MDINEVKGDNFHRHPWELSRTACVINDISKYIDSENDTKYINIGAGDLYFDEALIEKRIPKARVVAVDIGYKKCVPPIWDVNKCTLISDFADVKENEFDFALMMDSLEYVPDDSGFLVELAKKIVPGGRLFFTLPAFSGLYSEYDSNVGNLRRYSNNEFRNLISKIDGIEIEYIHYFYFSLLLVRLLQRAIGKGFAAHEDVTTQWKYSEKSIITKFVIMVLNIDYTICKVLRFIRFPGLSMVAVCRKKKK